MTEIRRDTSVDKANTATDMASWTPPAVAGLATSVVGAVAFLLVLVVEATSPNTFGATEYVATLISGVITVMVGSTASVVSNDADRKLHRARDKVRELEEKIARSS